MVKVAFTRSLLLAFFSLFAGVAECGDEVEVSLAYLSGEFRAETIFAGAKNVSVDMSGVIVSASVPLKNEWNLMLEEVRSDGSDQFEFNYNSSSIPYDFEFSDHRLMLGRWFQSQMVYFGYAWVNAELDGSVDYGNNLTEISASGLFGGALFSTPYGRHSFGVMTEIGLLSGDYVNESFEQSMSIRLGMSYAYQLSEVSSIKFEYRQRYAEYDTESFRSGNSEARDSYWTISATFLL